ncbi:4-hydroxy-tetrahydrodipicolinate reductase [Acinetobacter sp.]|jgi:4-hydroxy-tetrahydrodipicolinate reductase|uniref:4-hydroxy-tetrahydrodipicolinate reductase n=1 Tax=Acinetobacter sp. TaxID=472 RepID=UPI002828B9B3|nr:4-hydroxy-tetrahydrodipicolinate reductase [Acinetobacter sp.]MDR0238072.1 4-hydroxy-tetrahydrodipicolinate reductase [Acinetobacter sp.]
MISKNQQNIRVGILGVTGRMGQMLVQASIQAGLDITVATGRSGSPCIGQELGAYLNRDPLDVIISEDLAEVIQNCDVVIDFTTAEALSRHLEICHQAKKPIIIGITGLSESLNQRIVEMAQAIPIVHSGNYSIGVNLSVDLVRVAAQLLGHDFEVEIIEAHHRHKIDAPSGTALMYADAIAELRQQPLPDLAIYQRLGNHAERDPQSIGLQAIRGGDIVGEHSTIFFDHGEQIEIKHIATNRMNFATGAVRAALWSISQASGLYDMHDVINFHPE